jgi:hypothetical protein
MLAALIARGRGSRYCVHARSCQGPAWAAHNAAVCVVQVYLLQKAVPPASTVLISSLPQKVVVAVPEAVVALLLFGQATMFAASQLKGLTALMLYRSIPRPVADSKGGSAQPAAETAAPPAAAA